MGYYMENREAHFVIKAKNVPAALEAIRSLAKQTHKGSGGSWSGGKVLSKNFAWVNTEEIANAKNIQEAFETWRWTVDLNDETGDVCSIYFDGEKMGDEDHLFNAVAPYVESGCYIEMSGEDGAIWRWSFDGGECHTIDASMDWDDCAGMINKILENKEILPTLIGMHPGLDARIAKVPTPKKRSKK